SEVLDLAERMVEGPTSVQPVRPLVPQMVLIPAGEFLMGSDPALDRWAREYEQPQHSLFLPAYAMAVTPVTNAQYAPFVAAGGQRGPLDWQDGRPPEDKVDHPVARVSWNDALAYCEWLSEVTGKTYRLPTAAEWEKGARGTDGRIFPWGDLWHKAQCNTKEGGVGGTTPVGSYPDGASPYGLLDMLGNVWEWCSSLHRPYPYRHDDGREDMTASGDRELRGGSWDLSVEVARCAVRSGGLPLGSLDLIGFRVVSPA
ncbi:MAG TPA: formylglycine-generating enzyme family protein, partial [Anaerolineae bacterium]|nr:formylglycine-generating enzyme family protein [Anaerolineae bacterium]